MVFLQPFFSGFFFLLSSLGGGLWTAAAGEAEGAGPVDLGAVGFELHSTMASADGMATSRTAGRIQAKGLSCGSYLLSSSQVSLMTDILCTHIFSQMLCATLQWKRSFTLQIHTVHYSLVVPFHAQSWLHQHDTMKWYRRSFIYTPRGRTALLMQTVLMGKWHSVQVDGNKKIEP